MGKIVGRTTVKTLVKTADIVSSPFLLPTNFRKAGDNKRDLFKYDYRLGIAVSGLIVDMPACIIPLMTIDTNPKLGYAPAVIIGANVISGIYETIRYAYKRTEMRLNAKREVKGDSE